MNESISSGFLLFYMWIVVGTAIAIWKESAVEGLAWPALILIQTVQRLRQEWRRYGS